MKKAELIRCTLKELIENLPLKDITVQKLCAVSGIKRQTFYYHFSDIYDVIVSYFLNEEIENIEDTKSWSQLIHTILHYVNQNRQLILKTLKSDASEAVESFFYNNLYKQGRKFVENKYSVSLNKNDISEVTKLMSDTLSRELSRLLVNPMELSIATIEEKISKTFDGVIDLICLNKSSKKKEKKL